MTKTTKKNKKKILLIEDDVAIIDIYETVLKAAGFEVETITTGSQSIEEINKTSESSDNMPDLVLLDLILPDMNGLEVLEKMRKNDRTKDLPVFILTNYTSQDLMKAGEKLGAEKFLLKTDFTPSQLVKVVKKRLQ